jgi:hypothetical protein
VDELHSLLKLHSPQDMNAVAVSRMVNEARHDGPECLEAT